MVCYISSNHQYVTIKHWLMAGVGFTNCLMAHRGILQDFWVSLCSLYHQSECKRKLTVGMNGKQKSMCNAEEHEDVLQLFPAFKFCTKHHSIGWSAWIHEFSWPEKLLFWWESWELHRHGFHKHAFGRSISLLRRMLHTGWPDGMYVEKLYGFCLRVREEGDTFVYVVMV